MGFILGCLLKYLPWQRKVLLEVLCLLFHGILLPSKIHFPRLLSSIRYPQTNDKFQVHITALLFTDHLQCKYNEPKSILV